MTPEPFTPPECDLRGMPYMPLDVVRLFDSDFYALSNGDEFKAGLSLWCKAFLQVPAGSLPDDDRLLAHLSGAGQGWKRVKDMALRGWVKCSDGRLYHRTVAEKALEAWKARLDRRARTEAARAARQSTRADSGSTPPPSVTDTVTGSVTDNVTPLPTRNVTTTVTASKGTEGKGREDKKEEPELRSGAGAPENARSQLWSEGLTILRELTGQTEGAARRLMGRLCQSARDDCPRVFNALWDARDARPLDPVAWLMAAVKAREKPADPFMALIEEEGIGLNSLDFPLLRGPSVH